MRAAAFLLPTILWAQADEAALSRMLASKQQVTAYLEKRAEEITRNAAAEVSSPETWARVKAKRLEEMRDMLGLLPWPVRTPLNIRVTARHDKGSYWVENIAFESSPKLYVTGNLYVPKSPGKKPAIVYVCGHAYSPQGNKTYYQRHGISFAKNGYVAFILDSIQAAESFAIHHGVGWQEMYEWYSRGYTPAGVEVWNAMRAIDYLETRPEVDAARIGMTGRSGGAAMSWFTAAVDPRVKAVAPVMGISTYSANVKANTQRLHCDCMFTVNSWMHGMLHQGALIWPRPLMMAHGRKDDLFPIPGYEEFEQTVGGMYRAAGREGDFGNVVVDTGHQDSDFLREKAVRFFDRHLLGAPADRRLDMDYSNAPPEQLAAFENGPPGDAVNYRIHETFTPQPAPETTTAAAWKERSSSVLAALKQRVIAPRPAGAMRSRLVGKSSGWEEYSIAGGDGVEIRMLVRRPAAEKTGVPGLLYVASDGEDPRAIEAMLRPVNARNASVRAVVYPRGVGEIPWDKSFWKDTLRNAMHTGLTVDTMRLWDVQLAIEALRVEKQLDAARIMTMGEGVSGALALYAAILDPAIAQATLIDPPESHTKGPVFLNVLRHTDLPEAAALLSPRRLNFYARMPAAFERTRRLYGLNGHADHVFLTMQLDRILEGRYDHAYASGF
ncbi:MAG: acetylxylan esterase [Bryobacteraceae bacterium]